MLTRRSFLALCAAAGSTSATSRRLDSKLAAALEATTDGGRFLAERERYPVEQHSGWLEKGTNAGGKKTWQQRW